MWSYSSICHIHIHRMGIKTMSKRSKNREALKDFYEILDVPKNASEKAIQKAFWKMARKCHPDLNPNDPDATRKFKEAAKAYQILKSEDKRNEVDAMIISEFCNSFLGSLDNDKKPVKKHKSEFLRILKG